MTKTTLVYKTVTFPGLAELMGLWEEIPARAQAGDAVDESGVWHGLQ